MYIVHRGIAMHNAKLITKGNVWGEDIILSSKVLRSKAQARAMNYLEVYFTTRTVLMYLSRIYPKTGMKVRKAAIILSDISLVSLPKYDKNDDVCSKLGTSLDPTRNRSAFQCFTKESYVFFLTKF